MKHFKTIMAAAAIAAASLTTATSAFAGKLDDILDSGEVRIGVLGDAAPWGFHDENGDLAGFDIELAKQVAADLGVDLDLVEVTGPARIPSLLSDQIDILIAAAGATPERAQQVMFTTPYVAVKLGVYGKADAPAFETAEDLAGQSISVARGSTLDVWLTDNAPEANIVRFDDTAAAMAAYFAGQTDFFAENSAIALGAADGRDVTLKFLIRQSPAHAAVAQGEHDLLQWLNTDLFYNRMSGKLQALQSKWFNEATALPWM
ncbi:MAG: ABC transporter substrate-binding protein [Rhizobiaceae bacterium]|nr:ABC transporter substrate-binding protein [Rhizobiaceae bacterium]